MGRKQKEAVNMNTADASGTNSTTPLEFEVEYTDKQYKKQTDAFKMLMDSRNKVIGYNSPGKNRRDDTCNEQEIIEKKEIKAKRLLSLQKMAESKGSIQQQEREELRETYVNSKMEKRAVRLKNMLTKTGTDLSNKLNKPLSKALEETLNQIAPTNTNILNSKDSSETEIEPPIFEMSNFASSNTCNESMSKEEIEFLKKLSPSLKKKENMLCYFNVITKEPECYIDDSANEGNNANKARVIKVKFTKKSKQKKKTVNMDSLVELEPNLTKAHNENNHEASTFKDNGAKDTQRRKRKKDIHEAVQQNSIDLSSSFDTRPRRNIKRPVKYADDTLSVTSDEELHIFTPKKKKNSNEMYTEQESKTKKTKTKKKLSTDQSVKKCLHKINSSVNSPKDEDLVQVKKPAKLAPIFTAKSQMEELKAKQKFLHSGIPNHLKKCKNQQIVTTYHDSFQKVCHVQQISSTHERNKSVPCMPSLICEKYVDKSIMSFNLLKELLMHDTASSSCKNNIQNTETNTETLLYTMKQLYTKFPVYRTYHLLKAKSRGEFLDTNYGYLDNSIEIVNGIIESCNNNPDKFKWTDKYKATSTNQLIGNFDSVKELKKWLISWTETDLTEKNDSDSSDFYNSDTDSGDALRMKNNLLIITGKTGSGKTASVYTVALELSIKVIEVNASSKRTGKIMLQDLQEATQSHKVDRQRDLIENSQKSLDKDIKFLKNNKKQDRPAKVNKQSAQKSASSKKNVNIEPLSSQESLRTVMSLILIDDADIVFDQDEGFCSAISQLVHSSKRPVILVTESLQCPHLQKFLKYSKIINMNPFQSRMLGTWLDIMCLVEVNTCYPGLGGNLLDFFKGDIRKAINYLQYYMMSQKYIYMKESASQESDGFDKHDNDECSSMSWAVNENLEEKASYFYDICSSNVQYFMAKLLNLHCQSPHMLFNVWWSLPNLLGQNLDKNENDKLKRCNISELDVVANVVNTFSMIDLLQLTTSQIQPNITSTPWFSPENFSLLDTEDFSCYDKNNGIRDEISQHLMSSSITYAQKILECGHKTELQFPSSTLHRDRDKTVGRHKKLASYLNPSIVLDRKAVSLDYWSCCRTICRAERTKTDSNSKRNNRFCHYLKSLNIVCKNDYFDELSKSLCSDEKINK